MTLAEEYRARIRANLTEEMKIVLQEIDERIEYLERNIGE